MKKVILLLVVGIVGWIAFNTLSPLTVATAESASEPPGSYPADHIIRITAKLEFDGKPVVVDELVTCLAEGAGGSTSGRQFLSFQPNRIAVAVETPDGGMIMFSTRRSFCYVYAKTWGDYDEELTVPVGWTPVLTWYDRRDPRELNEWLWYVSETALTAENGRLKIIEDFEITIPEHPFSDALLAEAEVQAVDRNFCLGQPEGCIGYGRYPSMIAIPEDMWRNPDPEYLRVSPLANRGIFPQPLIDYLDGLGAGEGVLAIPFNGNITELNQIVPEEALRMAGILGKGRNPDWQTLVEQGIPKSDAERFGLLMSEAAVERYKRWPLQLNRFDEHIPWKCQDGFLVPDFNNPGLLYGYRRSVGCLHAEVSRGLMWPDNEIVESWVRFYGELFFDFGTKILWHMH